MMELSELIMSATEVESNKNQSEKLSPIPTINNTQMLNLKSNSSLLSILKPIIGLSDWIQDTATLSLAALIINFFGFSTDLLVCPKISTKKSIRILSKMASQLRNSEEPSNHKCSNDYFPLFNKNSYLKLV